MSTIFSEHIKELRNIKEKNQADFAKLIGTNQSTLSAYENGDRFPPYETLICIAQQCQVSLDWLCGLSDKKSPSNQIETYTDLINIIMNLKDTPNISVDFSLEEYKPTFDFESPYYTLLCEINDKHIVDFFEEWKDILSVCKKSPSGDKLYQIWLKDILERYNFPLENLRRSFTTIEELPFN